jgi:colanic acid biosynthesis glycosyl transferase WcaI
MPILFINRYFYPDLSATAQMLTELAEDLDARGEIVTVITGRTAYLGDEILLPAKETHKGIHILRVGSTNFGRSRRLGRLADYISFSVAALWAALRSKRQDCLVVLSDPPLLSVIALIVGLLNRVKTVCWLQDIFPDIAFRAGVLREGLVGRLLQRIARWSLHRMDQIVVHGRCMAHHLLSCGLSAHKMIRILNWSDGSHVQPVDRRDNEFLEQHHLRDRFVVMYSGNLGVVHEFKTILALIRGTRSIREICFCFVGEGSQKRQLVEAAQREDWQHVLFLPYQPKERLKFSLSAGDVHLVSLRAEMVGLSIPSKIYGIMAAGRPVIFIGPADSEVAALIREAGCGHVVQPGDGQGAVDALLACYRDRVRLEKQGEAARTFFERYCDRPVATEKFWRLLRQVTTSHQCFKVSRRA